MKKILFLIPTHFPGHAENRHRRCPVNVRRYVGSIVDEHGHPRIRLDIGVFTGGPCGGKNKTAKVIGCREAHEVAVGLISFAVERTASN